MDETNGVCVDCGASWDFPDGLLNSGMRHVRGSVACLRRQLAAAQAVIAKLPKTEDGVLITLNMTLYWESDNPDTLTKGKEVSCLQMYDDGWDAFWCEMDGTEYCMPDDFGLYSTEEAAAVEAAALAAQETDNA